MANKKLLGAATSELKLPTKKAKGEKKPKWQAKTGKGKAKSKEDVVAESVEMAVEMPTTADEQPQDVATAAEMPTTNETLEPAPSVEPTETPPDEEPATDPEPTPKKGKKLKVKTDLKPKKMSMMAAALQVLQDRKVPMTCPEMIDVMATEGLWVSPGGKTPASTLYAAIGRSIKDQGKASAFRKTERGKFEAKILPKE